ncbi:rhomboid family intramembrane serine protease [Dissulfurirhabdus thermomarina]|uniref:Rhomboid family intramembrane serine protease n=1 Tax=Dissulfurirhabdus thermomarina TaxID=1765737 RepID=A0A6N9TNP8_DISTH|nr:rhomboid family intramembrane serine protease [Dissulfurirhabdus thermomarina]NDY42678.1 rhomboid family intramembrane serine protease [Dissulfurirhabdus thermomarina]NMX23731.1 rhomboid family intramembrane serine protease [Dissulfurirhabdus thermomarina]
MIPIQDSTPRHCPPVATWTLIGVNLTIFLFETWIPEPLLQRLFYLFGVVPARFVHPDWAAWNGFPADSLWPFVTALFLHGGWIHVLANMWTLWIFGDNVEDAMGPWRFLAFYLACGIAADLAQIVANPEATVPMVGASGAIAGVMGAYYVLYPRARIVLLVPVFFLPFFFEVSAFFYLAFWFFEQVFSGSLSLGARAVGGVAWWAHIGGFLCGVFLHRPFLAVRRRCGPGRDPYRPLGFSRYSERY